MRDDGEEEEDGSDDGEKDEEHEEDEEQDVTDEDDAGDPYSHRDDNDTGADAGGGVGGGNYADECAANSGEENGMGEEKDHDDGDGGDGSSGGRGGDGDGDDDSDDGTLVDNDTEHEIVTRPPYPCDLEKHSYIMFSYDDPRNEASSSSSSAASLQSSTATADPSSSSSSSSSASSSPPNRKKYLGFGRLLYSLDDVAGNMMTADTPVEMHRVYPCGTIHHVR